MMKTKVIVIIFMICIGIVANLKAETLCDLNGEWDALFEHSYSLAWVGDIKSTLIIEQKGNILVAKSTKNSRWSKKGDEKIRAELDKEMIKNARYSRPDIGWVAAKSEMSKDCTKLIFDEGEVKVTLKRK
jgi:hypothetical protein